LEFFQATDVSGFGQHRLGRHHRAGPVGEGTTALQVVRLAAIEERDECTGLEQQLTGHASTTRERTHKEVDSGWLYYSQIDERGSDIMPVENFR
jgi:hypothetical protein